VSFLKVTHEGKNDAKHARKNLLIQLGKLSMMCRKDSPIVNHLSKLGKNFDTHQLNIKF